MVTRKQLDAQWRLTLVGGESPLPLPDSIPAMVPGCVHTDLIANGLIPDPFLDDNERRLAWIGLCDWEYETEFDIEQDSYAHRFLVFEGLDTVATITLDGDVIGEVANMHRTYRFDLTDRLTPGRHTLRVTFHSPIRYADRMSLELGYRPHVNHHPYNAIRKMAANMGWDWGIDTSTSGIWKPVVLESFTHRIEHVRPVTTVSANTAELTAHVLVTCEGDADIRLTVGNQVVTTTATSGENTVGVAVDSPRLWWPTGRGDPELYDLHIELIVDGVVVDSWGKKIGFRTIEVAFPKDSDSTGFEWVVNGLPTYIRGVNWIPNDAFVTRITRENLRERLTQARDAHINLIRVWGGGLYESDDFYELCDELGLMVWQDFLFACAAYAEEEPMRSEVIGEATDNIIRLMPHPSLALWNGNNENLWGFQEWRWETRLQGKTWGAGYYDDILPQLVNSLDPGRAYTPGSPYSPEPGIRHNDSNHGSVHIWDMWNDKDYPGYRDYHPRFVAEFGWQGPPSWSTLTSSVSDDPLTPESPGMLVHQKAMLGNDKLTDGLVNHFQLPDEMGLWHWAMQLNQAHAVWTGLTHMRSEYPRCMGSVVWQLNDCWPVTSWAAIDYYGVEKPLYWAIQHSYRDLLWLIVPSDAGCDVVIVNDKGTELSETVTVSRKTFDGSVTAHHVEKVIIPAYGIARFAIPVNLISGADQRNSYLLAEGVQGKAFWFFAEFKDSRLEKAQLSTVVTPTEHGATVSVTARNLVRDLALQADRIHRGARVDSGLITLEPGQSHTFVVTCERPIGSDDVLQPYVLVSANDLVGGRHDLP
jgi:beta-mannosidase